MHVDYDWSKRQLKKSDNEECAAGVPVEILARIGALPSTVHVAQRRRREFPYRQVFGKLIRALRR